MGFSKTTVWLIVVLMIISLAGLIGLQASLLGDALESKEATFRQNVMAAMGSVVETLEATETIRATMHVVGDERQIVISARTAQPDSCLTLLDTHLFPHAPRLEAPGDSLEVLAYSVEQITVRQDSLSAPVDPSSIGSLQLDVDLHRNDAAESDTGLVMLRYFRDSLSTAASRHGDTAAEAELRTIVDSNRVDLISRVMDRLVRRQVRPLEERLDPRFLDSVVHQAVDEYGIDLEPVWGIVKPEEGVVTMSQTEGRDEQLLASAYKLPIFPHDILAAPNTLALYFPDEGFYLLKQMGPLLIATFVFMAVVLFGFAYTVRTVVNQRRTTRLMVDFVNNMTHEFKTPISTVALACEAIMRPDVISDRAKVERFSNMIRQENRRMRHQAEKILQMAALEEKEGKVKLAPVDLHGTIRTAADSIALQVEQSGGRIECRLDATRPIIEADAVHLTGIFYNLLDNAHKYSAEAPDIRVTTEDRNGGVEIVVEDHGVGLKPEDRRRVFEKYFRVSKGNVHDVKGFGLGLSYVNLMVRAHGGTISVESEYGRGTRMILWFPRPADGESSGDLS